MLSVGTQRRPVGLVEAKEENENTSLKCRSYRKAKESKTISPGKAYTKMWVRWQRSHTLCPLPEQRVCRSSLGTPK